LFVYGLSFKTNKKIEKHQLIRSFFVFNISYHH
jgi:hypothetical protein